MLLLGVFFPDAAGQPAPDSGEFEIKTGVQNPPETRVRLTTAEEVASALKKMYANGEPGNDSVTVQMLRRAQGASERF